MSDNTNNTAAALDFAATVSKPEIVTLKHDDGREAQILITRGERGAISTDLASDLLADHASAPERRKGTITTHDLASFVALTNRDKRPDSVIFADVNARAMVAVLDFHGPADKDPRFCEDRVSYGFTFSPQYIAWTRACSGPIDQKTFARLIDDRLSDIADPGSDEIGALAVEYAKRRGVTFATIADLLVFTRTIATKSTSATEEQIDVTTGDVSIQFTKKGDAKTPDGKPVTPPRAFALRIPVLNGDAATQFTIAIGVRFEITDRGIVWSLAMNAPDSYIAKAIEEAVATVRKPPAKEVDKDPAPGGCGLPVFLAAIPA